MENFEKDIDIIHDYLKGSLAAKDKEAFELRLTQDAHFKELYDIQVELKSELEIHSNQELKGFLTTLESKDLSKQASSNKSKSHWWILAIITIGFLILGYMFVNSKKAIDYTGVYAEVYEPYPNEYVNIVRGNEEESDTIKAFVAYSEKKYREALDLLKNLPEDKGVAFYKAMCLQALEDCNSAIEYYNTIVTSNQQEYVAQSLWYQSLCLIKQNRIEEAKDQLQELQALNGGYKATAVKELLDRLN